MAGETESGASLLARREYARAVPLLKKEHEKYPSNPRIRLQYADARRAFEEVFEADTAGDLADNALFWIGETYFAAGDFSNAMRFYARVVNDYSDQNKAPDSLFKTAMAQARTGDLALARKTLQQVIDRYPFSSPASAAKAELQRIRY